MSVSRFTLTWGASRTRSTVLRKLFCVAQLWKPCEVGVKVYPHKGRIKNTLDSGPGALPLEKKNKINKNKYDFSVEHFSDKNALPLLRRGNGDVPG